MRPRGAAIARRQVAVVAILAAALGAGLAARSVPLSPRCRGEGGESQGGARRSVASAGAELAAPASPTAHRAPGLPAPAPSPSAGWEDAAGDVLDDLQRVLAGDGGGAYAEARAEAARRDLALFPPAPDELRRLLRGSARDRTLALAALAARPELDDDLLRLVLRSQRPEDADVVRLLGAELAAAVPADLAARHEDDLLRAFEDEPNPLVLAVALPALERMDGARLRALLRAQTGAATPEMLPVLLALARDRLSAGDLDVVAAAVAGR